MHVYQRIQAKAGDEGGGAYFEVGKTLSLEGEPSSSPATYIVRVLLLQVPNLVIPL